MNLSEEIVPNLFRPLLKRFRIDFAPLRSPTWTALIFATVVALVGSIGADALLVALGTKVFPSTRGYGHFQFLDYSKLTIIGVVIACAGWPIVTRITSTPRWLFLRAAVLVSVVLLVPDVYLWIRGASVEAVFVLVWMHGAIALVTYNALVHLAPALRARHAR